MFETAELSGSNACGDLRSQIIHERMLECFLDGQHCKTGGNIACIPFIKNEKLYPLSFSICPVGAVAGAELF